MSDAPQPPPLSSGALALAGIAAHCIGGLVVVGFVLPAEFNIDPLGLGRATGVDRLWAPPEIHAPVQTEGQPLAREYPRGFRTDVVEIPLTSGETSLRDSELEYKVAMRKGATLIYEWRVSGVSDPNEFYFDFHGHTVPRTTAEPMVVSQHRKDVGLHQQGALVAPFDGIQGWFFQNQSARPAVVRLRISGFYDLVPPGRPGNEAGVVANVPAAQARPRVN